MSADWPWSELGLSAKSDERAVKRAYAARLKEIDREDPVAFQQLRDAFDAAKRQAKPNTNRRQKPKMAQIVRGEVAPLSPDNPPQRSAEARTPAKDAAPPTPPASESAPAIADHPPNQTASPWPDTLASLDALYEEQPWEARSRLFSKLNDAIEGPNWDTQKLSALFSLQMAQDPGIRPGMEGTLFNRLKDHYLDNDTQTIIGPKLARLLEDEFAWASDGVRFSRRFQYHDIAPLIINDVLTCISEQSLAPPKRGKKRTILPHRVASVALVSVFSHVSYTEGPQLWEPELMLGAVVATGILFTITLVVILLLREGFLFVMRVTLLLGVWDILWDKLRARVRVIQSIDIFLHRPLGWPIVMNWLATLLTLQMMVSIDLSS